jgi:phytol kinase
MMTLDLSPWLVLPAIMAGVVLLFVALHAWQVWAQPHPELVRKLFHLGGGFLALPLPWLFTGFVPVLVLGVANLAFFALLRTIPALRSGLGQVLSGVQRNTAGEFCFVLSLLLLFHLARDTPLFYGVPLLILAVADAFAAFTKEFFNVGSCFLCQCDRHYFSLI